jgi:calcium-dependent protein kinase
MQASARQPHPTSPSRSLGVFLYVILSGLPAFWGPTDGDIFDAILSSSAVDLTTAPWPAVSPEARDLVVRLLVRDPDGRISAGDALRHPWLRANGACNAPLDPVVPRRLARFAGMSKLRKAALITVAGGLTETESAAMRELFTNIDADGNGRITAAELHAALDAMAPDSALAAASGALEAAVAAVSGSGGADAGLDFSQFVAAAHSVAALTRESKLASAFAEWDTDASGGLTLDEVRGALAGAGLRDDGDLASAFAAADASGDGELDFSEFVALATAALEARPADASCRAAAHSAVRLRAEAAADEVVAKSA